MIRFENVSKVYPRSTRPAIDDVTIAIERGEFVFVVGPSGSGKSTILRLALREEAATAGTVLVAGHDLNTMAMRQVPRLRREMGAVFQDFRLLPNKTVHENVAYALQVIGKPGHVIRQLVPETLEMVGLGGKEKRFPHQLSGGEQQRVAIARAVVNRPQILLCDEPTGNLDQVISLDIVRLLERINRTGTTIVMATHDHDIVNDLRRNMSMAVSVILVTMVSMFLLGLGLLAQRQADTMKGYWYDRIQVSIYLCTANSLEPNCENRAVTDAEKAAIQRQLEALPEVKAVFFESEQEAFERFKEQFRNSPIAGNVEVGDIPQSLRVQLADPTKYAVVTDQFEGAPGVALVQDQEKVLSKFFTIINYITVFAVMLAALMAACAALLMATTIRQAAFIRRREIGIMRLVGASNWTIRMPFVAEMVIVSVVGVGLAVGLLVALMQYVFNEGASRIALSQAFIGVSDVWVLAPWMALGVASIAVGTSLVTLRRYLRV